VRVRPGGVNATLERMSPIWEVQHRFGVEGAEWHPYWSNAGLVRAQPASVVVSLYLRRASGTRGPGALLVISNLSATEAVEAQVVLDLAALGLTGDLKATDALTGEHLALGGGKLAVPVSPVRMRMVEVQADAGLPQ
jgi:hypothetical protein